MKNAVEIMKALRTELEDYREYLHAGDYSGCAKKDLLAYHAWSALREAIAEVEAFVEEMEKG